MIESCKVDKNPRFVSLNCLSFLLMLAMLVLFAGCEKVEETDNYSLITLPENELVRAFWQEGDTIYIAGGEKESNGFLVAYSTIADQSKTIISGYSKGFHSVARNPLNGELYIGMSNSDLLTVDNLGNVTPHYTEEQYWINDQKKQPLYEGHIIQNRLFFIGGGDLQFGVIRKQLDNDQFVPVEYQSELRSMVSLGGEHLLAVGNGIQITSDDLGETWDRKSSASGYFTSVCMDTTTGKGWMTTFQGAIYNSDDNGENWEKEQTSISTLRSPFYLKRIKLLNHTDYEAAAVGNNGSLAIKPKGKSWELMHLSVDDDLNDFIELNDQLWIGGQGRIIVYPL